MDDELDDDEYYSDEMLEEQMGDYVFVDDEDDPQWIRPQSLASEETRLESQVGRPTQSFNNMYLTKQSLK